MTGPDTDQLMLAECFLNGCKDCPCKRLLKSVFNINFEGLCSNAMMLSALCERDSRSKKSRVTQIIFETDDEAL